MEKGKSSKKVRAAILAGALTGTLAWLNMNQEIINEFRQERNPGGRLHDDFNGMENKDIYAENFTEEDDGEPVYVRVRLLEYMEIGEDAGVDREATVEGEDGTTQTVTNPDRKVTVVAPSAKDATKDADINDTSTWRIHKPDSGADVDPFHEYWSWVQDGTTTYMPTFNRNKDSLSVDVNGTYVGKDGVFEEGTPYDDYESYTAGAPLESDAYYDADDNDVDENFTDAGFVGKPGGGGTEYDAERNPTGNYTKEKETHVARPTLNSLGVVTMKDWLDAGKPICNKWVWDTDGWFYWPEPVLPQTATGLLLNKLEQVKMPNEKCYYAIEVVGQFASAGDWGTPEEREKNEDGTEKVDPDGNPIVTKPATGFYADGLTDNAVTLLNKAAAVELGEDNGWYLYQGDNVYKKILDDKGTLSDPICAGEDLLVGNSDDRTDVVYVDGAGLTVNGTNYGHYFLKPAGDVKYYRAVGLDGLLGTADDDRLWLMAGEDLATGTVLDKVVTDVIITPPADSVAVDGEENMIEGEVGKFLDHFTAQVKVDGVDSVIQDVTWSVAASDGSALNRGTSIDPATGKLTIARDETARYLTVTATSKMDDRQSGTYQVRVYGKKKVLVLAENGAQYIKAGESVRVSALFCRGNEPAAEQPTSFTWQPLDVLALAPDALIIDVDPDDSSKATVTIGRGHEEGDFVKVAVTCNVDGVDYYGEWFLGVLSPEAATVQLTQPDTRQVQAGGELTFSATVEPGDKLQTTEVSWSVGTSPDSGNTLNEVEGVSFEGNVLKVAEDYELSRGRTVYVHATALDPTALDPDGRPLFAKSGPITIVGPKSVEVSVADGGEAMIHAGTRSTLQMKAVVKDDEGNEYPGKAVEWQVTRCRSATATANAPATTVDTDGVLHMGNLEYQGSKLEITAASKADPNIKGTIEVEVGPFLMDGREFKVGNIDYIVLAQTGSDIGDGEKYYSFVITKYAHGRDVFATQNGINWTGGNCKLRTACDDWSGVSGNQTIIRNSAKLNIAVRETAEATNFVEKQSLGFWVPSEADMFGTTNGGTPSAAYGASDYTWGAQFRLPEGKMTTKLSSNTSDSDANIGWWLRSLHTPTDGSSGVTCVAAVDPSGNKTVRPYNDAEYGYRVAVCVQTSDIKSLISGQTPAEP